MKKERINRLNNILTNSVQFLIMLAKSLKSSLAMKLIPLRFQWLEKYWLGGQGYTTECQSLSLEKY